MPGNPDESLNELFVEQYLNFMKSKKDDELFFFADGVHPTHNSMPAYGWIRKGKVKELESNSGRSRLNIHGAMNAETFETTVVVTRGLPVFQLYAMPGARMPRTSRGT